MALFALEKVALSPDVALQGQEVKITGKVTLFGIPFLGLAWIIAKVIEPKAGLDITSPILYFSTVASLGKFTIDIPDGFNRQGTFKVDVLCYLGPTEDIVIPPTTAALTIPPFPALASFPTITYTVSGTLPPVSSEFVIGDPVAPSKVQVGTPITVGIPITNTTSTDASVVVQLQVAKEEKFLFISWKGSTVSSMSSPSTTVPAGQKVTVSFTYTETTPIGTRDLVVNVSEGNTLVGKATFAGVYNVVKTTVAPPLESIPSGGTVSVTFSGFPSNVPVTVELIGTGAKPGTTVPSPLTTDANGNCTFEYVDGGSDAGTYTLQATDAAGDIVSAQIQITAGALLYVYVAQAGQGDVLVAHGPPYFVGEVELLTAQPASGYYFDYWLINGQDYSYDNPLSITLSSTPVTVTAYFTTTPPSPTPPSSATLTVTVTPAGYGTVTQSPAAPYTTASIITLTAVPASGHQFASWTLDGFPGYTENPIVIELHAGSNTAVADFS